MGKLYNVKESPGKGKGVFAKKAIPAGTVIMRDRPAMKVDCGTRQPTDDEVKQAFNKLDKDQQQQFITLHEGHRPFKTKLLRIFKANCFGAEGTEAVYLNISRINHACMPNAEPRREGNQLEETEIITTKPIAKGEEILWCYSSFLNGMVRQQRQNWVSTYYGFKCSCATCSSSPKQVSVSDARRQRYRVLDYKLKGYEPPDFSFIDNLTNATQSDEQETVKLVPLMLPLTMSEEASYNVLAARLVEAEGLVGKDLAMFYAGAATALQRQIEQLQDASMVVFGFVQNVIVWLTKAKDIMRTVRGAESKEYKDMESRCKILQQMNQLVGARV